MGFLSGLFGGKKEDPLKNAFESINRILSDEDHQNNLMQSPIKELITGGVSFDRNPMGSGPFGYAETNSIPVNGPLGELAYLSRLETLSGERIMFHRLGSINCKDMAGNTNTVDAFEAVSFDGKEWFILYLDFYHPKRSREYPQGFKETSAVPQFCGFNKYAANFPYDFREMKEAEQKTGLSMAYLPLSRVMPQIDAKMFNRPDSHLAKLNDVKKRLTFRLS